MNSLGPLRRVLVLLVGIAALAVLVVGVVTVVVRQGDDDNNTATPGGTASTRLPSFTPTPTPSPNGTVDTSSTAAGVAVDTYYGALEHGDTRTAFALLCQGQTAVGYGPYAAEFDQDEATGTSITGWQRTADVQAQLGTAFVKGTVSLANGSSTPITVQLTLETAGWRVCSSDLGGVLPGPGTSTVSPGSGA